MADEGRPNAEEDATKDEESMVIEVEKTLGESILQDLNITVESHLGHPDVPITIESRAIAPRSVTPLHVSIPIFKRETPAIGEADPCHCAIRYG